MMSPDAYIDIFEEPASKLKRFRYESEGRSAPLEGVRTTPKRKSFPSIRIPNFNGKATVIVSCVTADEPYRQHPHKLVGKNCVDGICYIPEFYTDSRDPKILSFPELRIQSCLISEIPDRLEERKLLNINPFNLSKYKDDLKRDIHTVRLCFQVLISPDPRNPNIRTQFEPKVSQPITNNKAAAEVKIHDISDTYGTVSGGKKMMIFCNKISKEDIQIRFFEEDAEKAETLIGWGEFQSHNVHRDVAIAFRTPKYDRKLAEKSTNIYIEMVRPSDNARSNRKSFQYVPDATDIDAVMFKKQQKLNDPVNLFKYLGTLPHNNFPCHVQKQQQTKPQCIPVQQPINPQQPNVPQQPVASQQLSVSQQPSVSQQLSVSQYNTPHQCNMSQLCNIPEQVNIPQLCNIPQQQQQHVLPQQLNLPQPYTLPHQYNLPHKYIPENQFNAEQCDPQVQYNPQQNHLQQQDVREPTSDELLNFEFPLSYYLNDYCTHEDEIMLSANENWNSEHNVAGASTKNWNQ